MGTGMFNIFYIKKVQWMQWFILIWNINLLEVLGSPDHGCDSNTFASPSLGGYLRHFCSLRLGALWHLCLMASGISTLTYLLTYLSCLGEVSRYYSDWTSICAAFKVGIKTHLFFWLSINCHWNLLQFIPIPLHLSLLQRLTFICVIVATVSARGHYNKTAMDYG